MKNIALVAAIALIAVACEPKPKAEASEEVEAPVTETRQKTYAEISHKTGGEWQDREYIGGEFQNVDALNVPPEHTDHSWFIRYEGPGWESNLVGYRLYLDWRNATDIFGKLTPDMVLAGVGQDGFDSYHEPAEWGMDILKVGSSLGIGSIGRLVNNEVMHFQQVDSTFTEVDNASDRSSVRIQYYGWATGEDKIDLTSVYSIAPDSRITKHVITPSAAIDGICTGIVKHDSTEIYTAHGSEWSYVATYGVQTLVPDKLGMAILYRNADAVNQFEGEFDHLVEFKPTTDPVEFYFLAAWEQEPGGITNAGEFQAYIDAELKKLNDKALQSR